MVWSTQLHSPFIQDLPWGIPTLLHLCMLPLGAFHLVLSVGRLVALLCAVIPRTLQEIAQDDADEAAAAITTATRERRSGSVDSTASGSSTASNVSASGGGGRRRGSMSSLVLHAPHPPSRLALWCRRKRVWMMGKVRDVVGGPSMSPADALESLAAPEAATTANILRAGRSVIPHILPTPRCMCVFCVVLLSPSLVPPARTFTFRAPWHVTRHVRVLCSQVPCAVHDHELLGHVWWPAWDRILVRGCFVSSQQCVLGGRGLALLTCVALWWGVAYDPPTRYGFHLLDVVLRSALIQETLHALRAYTASLGATAVLWLLLMYLFALVGHATFPSDFPEHECDTLPQCVAFTLNFGMRAGGGLGDVLEGGDGSSQGLWRMVR